MTTFQCRSCGGTYQDVLPDGMRYFHKCPPNTLTPRNENIEQDEEGNVSIISEGEGRNDQGEDEP